LGGATDRVTGESLGGASRLVLNAELQLPFSNSANDKTLRWFGFIDGGSVFAENKKIQLSQLRYSAGVGISWLSPIGPLKFSYARPLNAKPNDRIQNFQFQIGTGF
jgi:outer membrane protein insertion porin family